jgi:hypothetical protein
MSNIHNPVRQSDESFEAYKIRRAESNAANKANSQIGKGGYNTRKMNRDKAREDGTMKYIAGSYGKGLRNWIQRNAYRSMSSN